MGLVRENLTNFIFPERVPEKDYSEGFLRYGAAGRFTAEKTATMAQTVKATWSV
jgi:hypothetical protein